MIDKEMPPREANRGNGGDISKGLAPTEYHPANDNSTLTFVRIGDAAAAIVAKLCGGRRVNYDALDQPAVG